LRQAWMYIPPISAHRSAIALSGVLIYVMLPIWIMVGRSDWHSHLAPDTILCNWFNGMASESNRSPFLCGIVGASRARTVSIMKLMYQFM